MTAGRGEAEFVGGVGDPWPGLHPVVGTGVDPVTSRFSGARSTN
jgi:hypothetical protein